MLGVLVIQNFQINHIMRTLDSEKCEFLFQKFINSTFGLLSNYFQYRILLL